MSKKNIPQNDFDMETYKKNVMNSYKIDHEKVHVVCSYTEMFEVYCSSIKKIFRKAINLVK